MNNYDELAAKLSAERLKLSPEDREIYTKGFLTCLRWKEESEHADESDSLKALAKKLADIEARLDEIGNASEAAMSTANKAMVTANDATARAIHACAKVKIANLE